MGKINKDRGICENCGKSLETRYQTRFCSVKCRSIVINPIIGDKRKPPKPCAFCGALHKNKTFCSRLCGGKASKKGITYERLRAKRLRILVGVRKYQAKRLNQTPPDADFELIKMFYANCPEGYEVDHIFPISKGGKHHQDNLQYLLVSDNRKKSNKLNWTPSLSGRAAVS